MSGRVWADRLVITTAKIIVVVFTTLFPVVLYITWLVVRCPGVVFILVLNPTTLAVPHPTVPLHLVCSPSRPSLGPHFASDRILAPRVPRPQHRSATYSSSCATTFCFSDLPLLGQQTHPNKGGPQEPSSSLTERGLFCAWHHLFPLIADHGGWVSSAPFDRWQSRGTKCNGQCP